MTDGDDPDDGESAASGMNLQGVAIRRFFTVMGELVGKYTRLEYEGPATLPPPPALLVANHGFGGLFDLNAFALAAISRRLGIDDRTPAVILTHQMAWTIGAGPLLEPAGFRPAGRDVAAEALAEGRYVLVMPGGDLDGAKPWSARNDVRFGGRSGFARVAMDAGVPIVPIVVVGAGESLVVLSDGQRLARLLRADKLLRTNTFPITLSIPWGLTAGVTGVVVPYLPLPTKLRAAAGEPMWPADDEDAASYAGRVHSWMTERAQAMTRRRVPVLGWQLP